MSTAILAKTWKTAPYSGTTFWTLLTICFWTDSEGVCVLSIPEISKHSRLSESQVRESIDRLEDDGVLAPAEKANRTGYRFLVRSFAHLQSREVSA